MASFPGDGSAPAAAATTPATAAAAAADGGEDSATAASVSSAAAAAGGGGEDSATAASVSSAAAAAGGGATPGGGTPAPGLVSAFREMTGASDATAVYYLEAGGGTVDGAITLFFECGGAPAPASTSGGGGGGDGGDGGGAGKDADGGEIAPPEPATFTCVAPVSQFDFPEGRSACTTIGVEATLALTARPDPVVASTYEDTSQIVAILTQGIAEYKQIHGGGNVEHMSCAEVLLLSARYSQALEVAAMVQGTTDGTAAFQEELEQLMRGALADGSPACAIVTKPPETVIVLAHPGGTYAVFDSHPRQTLGIQGAYVSGFANARSAAHFLRCIFPCVPGLGDSMMAAMYNSFDFTALRRKS